MAQTSSASDKAILFAKNFNLDDSSISLPVFHSNLRLHNIFRTPKMSKKKKSHKEPGFIKGIWS